METLKRPHIQDPDDYDEVNIGSEDAKSDDFTGQNEYRSGDEEEEVEIKIPMTFSSLDEYRSI